MEELTGSIKGSKSKMEVKWFEWREFIKQDALSNEKSLLPSTVSLIAQLHLQF